jgi:hypothetical protein
MSEYGFGWIYFKAKTGHVCITFLLLTPLQKYSNTVGAPDSTDLADRLVKLPLRIGLEVHIQLMIKSMTCYFEEFENG